MSFIVKHIVR